MAQGSDPSDPENPPIPLSPCVQRRGGSGPWPAPAPSPSFLPPLLRAPAHPAASKALPCSLCVCFFRRELSPLDQHRSTRSGAPERKAGFGEGGWGAAGRGVPEAIGPPKLLARSSTVQHPQVLVNAPSSVVLSPSQPQQATGQTWLRLPQGPGRPNQCPFSKQMHFWG